MTIHDGPHIMHDPAKPAEDGVYYGQLANVNTNESGARIVSDGQRVYVLDDLLRRGYVFVPLVAMTPARIEAIRYARNLVGREKATEAGGKHLAELDALLAEAE